MAKSEFLYRKSQQFSEKTGVGGNSLSDPPSFMALPFIFVLWLSAHEFIFFAPAMKYIELNLANTKKSVLITHHINLVNAGNITTAGV